MLTDYHLHLRPDELDATAAEHFTTANVERYREVAEERGIAELGVSEHVYRFRAGARRSGSTRSGGSTRVDDLEAYCRFVRERDRSAAGNRGRLRSGERGPDGEPAGGVRLRLRGRLGALPARRLARHGGVRRLEHHPQRGGDLAALLPDAGGGGAQRPVRHPRAPRPGQGLGPRASPPGGRPTPLLRARDRGYRGVGDRGGGLHGRPAQARARALPRAGLPRDVRGSGRSGGALQRRPPPAGRGRGLRAGAGAAGARRCERAVRVRASHPPSGAESESRPACDEPQRDRLRLPPLRCRAAG